MSAVPVDVLERHFSYDLSTGIIVRKIATGARWKAGEPLSCKDRGYVYARLTWEGKKRKIYVHVLAWALHHGEYPSGKVGHRNDDCSDNRIANLVDRDDNQHSQRKRMGRNNSSGAKGVHWDAERQLWRAEILADGKRIFLGRFADKESALGAYSAASQEHHGDSGRVDVNRAVFGAAK